MQWVTCRYCPKRFFQGERLRLDRDRLPEMQGDADPGIEATEVTDLR
jgi:hypothetical protein